MAKNIAIICGGDSGESVISLQSAHMIQQNIDKEKYNPYLIFLNKQKWVLIDDKNNEFNVDKNDFSVLVNNKKITFDCAFIAIHGTPGEDGKLQGYFELIGLPYTGSDVLSSAITFNKNICKDLASFYGILSAKSVLINAKNRIYLRKILAEVKLPVMVKPNKGGSSIGTSKVSDESKLEPAIKEALEQDDEVLVEEFIEGRELTCGVIKHDSVTTVFPLTEIVKKVDFFDYEAKYDKEEKFAQEITPAKVTEKVETMVKSTASYLYAKFNCNSMVRFDFIYSRSKLYFLEVNTIPGLTEASIVPKQAQALGISPKDLYTMAIEDALKRFENQKK